MTRLVIMTATLLLWTFPCLAVRITVDDDGPADFNNIQEAIDTALSGDTVFVKSGYYSPFTNNESFPIVMKNGVILQGEDPNTTIIDGNLTPAVIETANNSAVRGFTIKTAYRWEGPHLIYGESSFVVMENNIISDRSVRFEYGHDIIIKNNTFLGWGTIIFAYADQVTVKENTFHMVDKDSVAVHFYYSSGQITNNIMHDGWFGIECYESIANISNNLIYDNMYGIYIGLGCSGSMAMNNNIIGSERHGMSVNSNIQIKNNIIIESGEYAVRCNSGVNSDVSYNDFWNNTANFYDGRCSGGIGNTFADPCFIDANNHDYHLQSQAGRWDANSESWVTDANTSLCIDAGDMASPIGFEPFPNGGRVNMGTYGGTAEASKSYFGGPVCETIVAGDINGDCKVDFKDVAILAFHWLEDNNE